MASFGNYVGCIFEILLYVINYFFDCKAYSFNYELLSISVRGMRTLSCALSTSAICQCIAYASTNHAPLMCLPTLFDLAPPIPHRTQDRIRQRSPLVRPVGRLECTCIVSAKLKALFCLSIRQYIYLEIKDWIIFNEQNLQ